MLRPTTCDYFGGIKGRYYLTDDEGETLRDCGHDGLLSDWSVLTSAESEDKERVMRRLLSENRW